MNEICLESSLLGFCTLNDDIVFLENLGVLLRNDDDYVRHSDRVMLISGGGSGHEPGPGNGFIGQGMLSCAVSGNLFTSPSVTRLDIISSRFQQTITHKCFSCLAAILQANDVNREILLIINNYTGDRLNFGLAVEMARNTHNYRHVKLLLVDDDCSIDNPRDSTGRRGLAGVNLISKIAGAMSTQGASLNEIYDLCSDLLLNRLIRTIGFCFRHDNYNVLTGIEIGYGIHGEPGSIKIERANNFKPVINIMKKKLGLNEMNEADAVLLFNNLGGASEYAFHVFVKEFMELIEGLPIRVVKVYAGKFLTSLSKEAISVTVLELRDPILEYLELPIKTPAGDLFNSPFKVCKPLLRYFEVPQTVQRERDEPKITEEEALLAKRIIAKSCKAAIDIKNFLNEMDGELGDGDTGTTLARGSETLLHDLNAGKINVGDPYEMMVQISTVLMDSMGGTSGAIFAIFFQCASYPFSTLNKHCIENWISGLSVGIEGIMRHGKSDIGDRTLLDSLQSGCERLKEHRDTSVEEALRAFAEGCKVGAETTKTMTPKSGRSAYSLSDKEVDYEFESIHPDPGAQAISVIAQTIVGAFSESSSKAT